MTSRSVVSADVTITRAKTLSKARGRIKPFGKVANLRFKVVTGSGVRASGTVTFERWELSRGQRRRRGRKGWTWQLSHTKSSR
jgi:hypothetical protein